MKLTKAKITICLIVMIVFIVLSFTTSDKINSQLFASLGIISGVLITKIKSTP